MAKPTKQEEADVTKWFMEKFWPSYPAKFCGRGRGSRAVSCKLMVAINPDTDEQTRIIGNLVAQARAHSQKPEQSRNYWKIGETYVRNQLWNDEIESAMESKAKQDLNKCCITDCHKDVFGEKYIYCDEHIPNAHSDLLAKAFKATGLKYGSPDFVNDCRIACRQGMNKLTTKMDSIK